MQAANLLTKVFRCGTKRFQTLAISRKSRCKRIFSVCLQRSVFPSTILWEVSYLAGKNSYCSAKSRKWSKLPPHFWLEMLYQVVPLTVLLSCSINIWILPTKRNWLHRKHAWQIHGNVYIYPNTSLNSPAIGLLFLVVGNANSRLPRQKSGLNLGLLHVFMLDKHPTLERRQVGTTTSLVSFCFQRFHLKSGREKKKKKNGWSNTVFSSTVLVWLPNLGWGRRWPSQKHNMFSLLWLPVDLLPWACQMEQHTLH